MTTYSAVRAWQRMGYAIVVDDYRGVVSKIEVDGIVMGGVPLGLHFRDLYGIDVTHIPSGKRIAKLPTLGGAMEFVHQVALLCDWSTEAPTIPEETLTAILNHILAGSYPPRLVP